MNKSSDYAGEEQSSSQSQENEQKPKGRGRRKASAHDDKSPVKSTPTKPRQRVEDGGALDPFNIPHDKNYRPLQRTKQKPLYNPPFYVNPEVVALPSEERAKLIFNYHLTILKGYQEQQRQSITHAEWGKPIHSSASFSGSLSLDSASQIDYSFDSSEEAEVFVSRSGRQTKRKLYTEAVFSDNDEEAKKKKRMSTPSPSIAIKDPEVLARKYSTMARSTKMLKAIAEQPLDEL